MSAPSEVTPVTLGFDQPLYMLPFDQRESFQAKIFGWQGALSVEQTAQVAAAKQVVYDGFLAAIAGGVEKEHAAILVDEQFGASILRQASRQGFITACPAEKSGQKEFALEYGREFASHVEAFDPTFCKVLIRYNPEGDRSMNLRQAARLRKLSDYLRDTERRFMFELLVPAERSELDELNGNKDAYDRLRRPRHMVSTIVELQDAGVEPDVWKVEGLHRREDCARMVAAARRDGRDRVGLIVLGRGADARQVEEWLTTAASVPGFIGFAVGRTTFWDALLAWRGNHITRGEAITEIARRYRQWVDIFEHATCTNA